jgi:hypothetical protein
MKVRRFDSALRFMVTSETGDGSEYLVDLREGDGGVCGCWRSYNLRERCKHIQLVREHFCDEMIKRVGKIDLNEPVMEIVLKKDSIQGNDTIPLRGDKVKSSSERVVCSKPPDLSALVEYCLTLDMPVGEAERIEDYWKANGFKTGQNRIKDWKAFVRNWNRTGQMRNGRKSLDTSKFSEEDKKVLDQDPLTMDDETRHKWTMLNYAQRR